MRSVLAATTLILLEVEKIGIFGYVWREMAIGAALFLSWHTGTFLLSVPRQRVVTLP